MARNARFHSQRTDATGEPFGLVNWYYTTAAIVLAEYFLATGEAWVKTALAEIRTFLRYQQNRDNAGYGEDSRLLTVPSERRWGEHAAPPRGTQFDKRRDRRGRH